MSKANPALIGGFVIGAIALVVIGILAFGGSGLFTERRSFVTYFPGSVSGLRIGAPVTFRGAQIGQVTDMKVLYDDASDQLRIPVVFEVLPERIIVTGDIRAIEADRANQDMQRLIQDGLRAQLQTQSMVTGLLYVNLEFFPDSQADLVGDDLGHVEVPAIASTLEEVQQTVGRVMQDVPSLVANLNDLLTTMHGDLKATSGNFRQSVADLAKLTERLRKRGPVIDQAIADGAAALASVRDSGETVDEILHENREAIGAMIAEWTETAVATRRMADQINNAIAENREGLQDFTSVGLYEWTGLAQDAQDVVVRVGRVVDELERNPSRFLFGGDGGGMRPEE